MSFYEVLFQIMGLDLREAITEIASYSSVFIRDKGGSTHLGPKVFQVQSLPTAFCQNQKLETRT